MNIYDSIRLASYSVAADAFNKSKDVFVAFIPLVESALLALSNNTTVSFLALQNRINEIYKVNIPKDTLCYLIRFLERQGKLDFVQNKTIVLSTSILGTDYIGKQDSAKKAIEFFFTSFQAYLSGKNLFPPASEIREQICNLIYTHSNELAIFIQEPVTRNTINLGDDEHVEEWEYTRGCLQTQAIQTRMAASRVSAKNRQARFSYLVAKRR